MGFSERAKLTALAIVHIFETSKPLGDYSAVAVLKDGAGVSYGKSQFTHRSGSLGAVLKRFHKICKECGTPLLLEGYEKQLANRSAQSIDNLSHDQRFKNGLKAAGRRPEMQQAQREIAFENYLKPAIEACEGSDFVLPLSLAVIYDSINHGSFAKIRDRVTFTGPGNGSIKPIEFEKEWISEYVRRRDAWLENHSNPLLRKTDYRTDFFLAQIAKSNWDLRLPVNVHGYRLTEAEIAVGEIVENMEVDTVEEESTTPAAEPATPPNQGGEPGPVEVKKEDTSLFVKLGAAVTAVTGFGINVGSLVQTKLEAMTVQQIAYMIAALGLIAGAIWWYRKSAKGAQMRTMQLVEKAADPNAATVRLVK